MADITDGTSNTLMFVEAKRDIPWTKPEDIPYTADLPRAGAPDAPGGAHSRYAANAPLPKFGGHYPGGFLAAIADGRVQFISNNLDPASLRAVITRDGGEPIGNALDNPPPTGLSPPVDLVPPVTPKPAR